MGINKKEMIAYRFVTDRELPPLETLSNDYPYIVKSKLLQGKKLTREECNKLYSALSYARGGYCNGTNIALLGWMFDFSAWLHGYYVEYTHGGISKVYSLDKTSIRAVEPHIKRITEFSN